MWFSWSRPQKGLPRGKCHVSFEMLKRNWCAVKLAAFPRGVTALIVLARRSRHSWNRLPRHARTADGCLFRRHLCCRAGVHCQFESIKGKAKTDLKKTIRGFMLERSSLKFRFRKFILIEFLLQESNVLLIQTLFNKLIELLWAFSNHWWNYRPITAHQNGPANIFIFVGKWRLHKPVAEP